MKGYDKSIYDIYESIFCLHILHILFESVFMKTYYVFMK